MRLVGHQPELLPWLGFWSKLLCGDAFVAVDTVQYQKRCFLNRNRILAKDGPIWINVPVLTKGRFHQAIRDVRISSEASWQRKMLRSLRLAYGQEPYFERYYPGLEDALLRETPLLADLNCDLLQLVMHWLEIDVPFLKSSAWDIQARSTDLIVELCRAAGADSYVSGPGGANYLDADRVAEAGIDLYFRDFRHPVYEQAGAERFEANLSILDLLFRAGPEARSVLEGCSRLLPAGEYLASMTQSEVST